MPEARLSWESIPWNRICPWLRVTRLFWIAADPRKLVLATCGLLLMSLAQEAGEALLSTGEPQPSSEATVSGPVWPWETRLGYDLWQTDDPLGEVGLWFVDPRGTLGRLASNWQVVLRPLDFLLTPLRSLGELPAPTPRWLSTSVALLTGTLIWAVFGGAIGRMAAVNFARDQQVSLFGSLRFSISHLPGYLAGPLLPLSGMGLCLGATTLAALIARIPDVGPLVVAVGWGLALIGGFAMVVLLLGLAAGWPLMIATVNVEGSDGFDGFSRAYNYTFERPWYYLFLTALVMTYGSLVIFFFWLCGQLMFRLSGLGLLAGAGAEITRELFTSMPPLLAAESWGEFAPTQAGTILGIWARVVATLVVAFVYSYFWSATTVIYFLLRRSVDSSDFNEVHLDTHAEPDPLLPIVGTAAMNPSPPVPAAAPPAGSRPPIDLTP